MRISIDNKLYMDCPEGFRQLTEEELQKMNLIAGGKGLCISDSERHIVISVTWTKVNATLDAHGTVIIDLDGKAPAKFFKVVVGY